MVLFLEALDLSYVHRVVGMEGGGCQQGSEDCEGSELRESYSKSYSSVSKNPANEDIPWMYPMSGLKATHAERSYSKVLESY